LLTSSACSKGLNLGPPKAFKKISDFSFKRFDASNFRPLKKNQAHTLPDRSKIVSGEGPLRSSTGIFSTYFPPPGPHHIEKAPFPAGPSNNLLVNEKMRMKWLIWLSAGWPNMLYS
jgi:hypothetical protein